MTSINPNSSLFSNDNNDSESAESTDDGVVVLKCNRRGCTITEETVYKCPGSKCDKSLHLSCFQKLHGNKDWFVMVKSGVVCTKKCHVAIKSSASRKPTWSNDGAEGPDDPQCSERILMDWILTPGNYANKWRGKDNKGVNKKQMAALIADSINKAGVVVERDAKQVLNKIQHLERQFREAYDFSNTETGQGLQEGDPAGFDAAVRKYCNYYFDLLDIFGDRASTQPKLLSIDNLDSSSLASSNASSDGSSNVDDGDNGQSDGDQEEEGSPNIADYSVSDMGDNEDSEDRTNIPQMAKGNTKGRGEDESSRKRKQHAATLASSKKKLKPVATILDSSTNDRLSSLAASKEKLSSAREKVAMATLRKLEMEEELVKEKQFIDKEKQRIETNFYKINRLKDVRENFPMMEDSEILELFPDFKDVIKYVRKKDASHRANTYIANIFSHTKYT
jgi:hypothetical protein